MKKFLTNSWLRQLTLDISIKIIWICQPRFRLVIVQTHFLRGWRVLVNYKFPINGVEKEFNEKYLEDHFVEIFPDGIPRWDVGFRKSTGSIHICPAAQPLLELTPEQHAMEVKRLNEAFRQKKLGAISGHSTQPISLAEWAIEKVQLPPAEQAPVTTSIAEDQEAWIRQRVAELERRPTENAVVLALTNEEKNPTTADQGNFSFVSPQACISMLLRQKELQAEVKSGNILSDEEQKELVILKFLLGSPGEEAIIQRRRLSLADLKNTRAIGEFTFGKIQTLLIGQGFSHEDVILRFIADLQSGAFTTEEANQFLKDCEAWDEIKDRTNMSRDEYFAKKLVAHKEARKSNPSNN